MKKQPQTLQQVTKLIADLHKQIELKDKQLQRLARLKSDFVSMISHELRTPLAIIKEGIFLVIDEIPGKINRKQKKLLLISKGNIDRLTGVIDGLLDIFRIESSKIELKKILTEPKLKQKSINGNKHKEA